MSEPAQRPSAALRLRRWLRRWLWRNASRINAREASLIALQMFHCGVRVGAAKRMPAEDVRRVIAILEHWRSLAPSTTARAQFDRHIAPLADAVERAEAGAGNIRH